MYNNENRLYIYVLGTSERSENPTGVISFRLEACEKSLSPSNKKKAIVNKKRTTHSNGVQLTVCGILWFHVRVKDDGRKEATVCVGSWLIRGQELTQDTCTEAFPTKVGPLLKHHPTTPRLNDICVYM